MRSLQVDKFKFLPALIGSLCEDAKTACGNSFDCRGFSGVLMTITMGAVASSSGACNTAIVLKLQTAEALGAVGASWTDITDGAINGSVKITGASITGSGATLYGSMLFERLDQCTHYRYLRPHLTATCTTGAAAAGLGVRYAVNLILCDPIDTLYAAKAASFATNNADYTYKAG